MLENFGTGNLDDLLSGNGGKFVNPLKGKTLALSPGKPVTVRVLGFNDPNEVNYFHFKSHYVQDPALPSSWRSKMKYVTCTGAGCPLCAAGHASTTRYGFLVIHLDNFEENEMGQLMRHPKKKILTAGITLAKMLGIKHKTIKPLSSANLQLVTIAGGGGKTTYSADFVEGGVPSNYDTNGIGDNFEVLKPTQRDLEEATRLAPFVKEAPQQQNTIGNSNGYAPQQPVYQQATYQQPAYKQDGYTHAGTADPIKKMSGYDNQSEPWQANPPVSGSWAAPNTVAGNTFFKGGEAEDFEQDSVPF